MSIEQVLEYIERACRRIAPAWSLENSVAVNPYLGLSDKTFDQAARMLEYRGNIKLYMPLNFYLKRINEGKINNKDIEKALNGKNRNEAVYEFLNQVKRLSNTNREDQKLDTLINIADKRLEKDFSKIMVDQVSEWMSFYFNGSDKTSPEEMFLTWKSDASHLIFYPSYPASGISEIRSSILLITPGPPYYRGLKN